MAEKGRVGRLDELGVVEEHAGSSQRLRAGRLGEAGGPHVRPAEGEAVLEEQRVPTPHAARHERPRQPGRLVALFVPGEAVELGEARQRMELVAVLGEVAEDDAGAVGDRGARDVRWSGRQRVHVGPQLCMARSVAATAGPGAPGRTTT
jgi:hypothetical protein